MMEYIMRYTAHDSSFDLAISSTSHNYNILVMLIGISSYNRCNMMSSYQYWFIGYIKFSRFLINPLKTFFDLSSNALITESTIIWDWTYTTGRTSNTFRTVNFDPSLELKNKACLKALTELSDLSTGTRILEYNIYYNKTTYILIHGIFAPFSLNFR